MGEKNGGVSPLQVPNYFANYYRQNIKVYLKPQHLHCGLLYFFFLVCLFLARSDHMTMSGWGAMLTANASFVW